MRMMNIPNAYRDLFKHSAIYGLGQILSRFASILLLPIYTAYLKPAEYGVIAILDLVAGLIGIVIGAGMSAAVTRYHFEARDEDEQNQVWWTGLVFVLLASTVIILPALILRENLAYITLGPSIENGGYFYTLILVNVGFNTVGQILDSYFRVQKWSGLSVSVNLIRLLLNIGLNVYFLAVLEWGITGVLLGNLITGIIITVVMLVKFSFSLGPFAFYPPLAEKLWWFGGPLIGTALLSSIMHEADRYFLREFLDMKTVGLYSLGYTIGQGVNSLCQIPFVMIWNVVVYEIAQHANAREIYVRVFEYYFYGIALVMLGVSLFAKDILHLMVAQEFYGAADFIPIVCLAYLFFGLHEHFKVPVMLMKKTVTLLPVVGAAACINLIANFLLIPILGAAGAAWASVITFMAFSYGGLWRYRQVERYEYPLLRCHGILLLMVLSFLTAFMIDHWFNSSVMRILVSGVLWLGWASVLFAPLILQWWKMSDTEPKQSMARIA